MASPVGRLRSGSQAVRAAHEHAGGALLVVVLTSIVLASSELSDGDLGFHLATGREVLASGRIPATNVLSYTNPEHPWLLHQWLPGVLFELLHRQFGVLGLQGLKVVLVTTTWLVVYGAGRLSGASAHAAALATVMGAAAASFRFQLRPYLFTLLALAITVLCAAAFLKARHEQSQARQRRALVAAALTAGLASHLHAGAIYAWLVLAALAFGCAIEPWHARLLGARAADEKPVRAALMVLAALIASIAFAALTLAAYHPYGARTLLFPFDMGTDSYLAEHLVEFRAPFQFPFAMLAPYWLLLGLGIVLLLVHARRTHAFWPTLLLGFALLSLKHARLAFAYAVVASPFVAFALSHTVERLRPRLVLLFTTVAAAAFVLHHVSHEPLGARLATHTFPPYLFDYVAKHGLKRRAYVSDAWAAPMLGRFYPEHRAFFDNRFEAYPRAFFVEVYQHIRYGLKGWDALLDRHGVEFVLMRYTSPGEARFQRGKPNLRQALARDGRWALVTFDDQGELFVRRRGIYREHARAFAIEGLDPDRAEFLAPPQELLPALMRELSRGNPSGRARVFAAHAAFAAGERALGMRLAAEASEFESVKQFLPALKARLADR